MTGDVRSGWIAPVDTARHEYTPVSARCRTAAAKATWQSEPHTGSGRHAASRNRDPV
jgi:hypothetical protein